MRQSSHNASSIPPFTRADQRQFSVLIDLLREHPSSSPSLAALERLLIALPALRSCLPAEQQSLIADLDRSEEMLCLALEQLQDLVARLVDWQLCRLDTLQGLQQLEELTTLIVQHATEVSLRSSQRREILHKTVNY